MVNTKGTTMSGRKRERYPERERYYAYKQLKLTGDLELAPEKARKRLGSEMSPKQRRAQMLHEKSQQRKRQKLIQRQKLRIINQKPTEAQLRIPDNVDGPVKEKALRIFGESRLYEESRRQVPKNIKISPKAILILGAPDLLPAKARALIGEHDLQLPGRYHYEGTRGPNNALFQNRYHGYSCAKATSGFGFGSSTLFSGYVKLD